MDTNPTRPQVIEMQVLYNSWQVEKAHSLDLAISLKNSLDLVPRLADMYDFAGKAQSNDKILARANL